MPRPRRDLHGEVFGELVVESFHGKQSNHRLMWLCRCSCQGTRVVSGTSLRTGGAVACVPCTRRAAVERRLAVGRVRQRERRAKLHALKAGPCVDCGQTFHPAAMDFDHVRGPKLFQIVSSTVNRADLAAELAKCDLRCANCHRIRHHGEAATG